MTRLRALIVAALGLGLLTAAATAPLAGAQAAPLSLTLTTQNNSGITGTVTLTDLGGGKTRVATQVSGAGAGPEPSHIHPGSCAQLNPTPAYTLSNVVNGSSTTDIDASLETLTASPFAVHLHKSQDELTVYVACADIAGAARPATLPRTGDLGGSWTAGAAGLIGLSLALGGFALRRFARRTAP
jgi:Cu/Zn superoxide dismutase